MHAFEFGRLLVGSGIIKLFFNTRDEVLKTSAIISKYFISVPSAVNFRGSYDN